jgi:hypothetical protein
MPAPVRVLLRGALVPIAVVGAVAAAVSALHSPAAAGAAGLGALLAAAAFSVGPLVMQWSGTWSPPAVMAAALTAYLTLIGVLAVVYLVLLGLAWLPHPYLGWTLMACAVASIAGQVLAAGRLRVLAFGSPVPAEPGAETAGHNGIEGGPHTGRD